MLIVSVVMQVFFVLMSSIMSNTKTMHSFSNYSFDGFFLISLSISIFSLAGVPPFMGFFSKMFLLNILSDSNMALLYFFLLVVLLLALYFYIQNIRFLHSTNVGYYTISYVYNERKTLGVNYYLLILIFSLSLGFLLIDDLLLIFTWLFF